MEGVDGTYKIYTACPACGVVDYHSETYFGNAMSLLMVCCKCGHEHRMFYHQDQRTWKNAETYKSRKEFNPFD